jgi:hypothetical protein
MFEKLLAKQHIRNLDLGSVRANLVAKLGWTQEQARQVEDGYKRWRLWRRIVAAFEFVDKFL